ncbi:TMEM175 family protein [Lacisediminihabitans changchengi]|uniref:DUF1211 domain-containing protein n=1 Tax=Lacisediminihabitans changchengi TaxID=2787634 RepID=A0A934W472_9MICO|nr:TMEM175 family protein [Lacisediminihabitans changchengi]MBK4347205.1 DUF1211 domain-containing protein [Lacisediminihabitans changchengi]
MGEKNKEYDRFLRNGTNTDRLQFFSDAVFAIAMTLLVIDIAVPTISKSVSDAQLDGALWRALGEEWDQFLAYGISFWVIAVNWAGHHRKFRLIGSYDQRLITANLALLFFIAFVPFPTSLISEYAGAMPAIVLYATVVSVISGLQWYLWFYAHRAGFLAPEVTEGMYRYVSRNYISVPLVFLLSIPVGYLFGGVWAMFFWILNWPASILLGNWEPKRRR